MRPAGRLTGATANEYVRNGGLNRAERQKLSFPLELATAAESGRRIAPIRRGRHLRKFISLI